MTMIIRRILLAGLALATFACFPLMAQQRDVSSKATVHRIGFLALRPLPQIAPSLSAFKDGMRDLGYVEDKDYILEVRLANDDPTRYPVTCYRTLASERRVNHRRFYSGRHRDP